MMDLSIIVSTIVGFIKLLLLVGVVSFVLYKIFSPVRKWIEEKYNLTWIKSAIILNFVAIFLFILLFYLYFAYIGFSSAPARDPDLEFNLFENLGRIAISAGRILIVAVILSAFLLFFELVASMFMGKKGAKVQEVKSSKKSKSSSNWIAEFIGIIVASALFLILILFVFDWAIFGLFIFIFYGSVSSLPLVMFF